jgi:hypothetical protein
MSGKILTENSANNSEKRGRIGNLKPWKRGQSGNPGGRPKRKPITEAYAQMLEDPELCKQIAQAVVMQILKGNAQVLKEFTDRVEGKVAERTEVSGPEGGAIEGKFVVEFIRPKSDREG